VYHIQDYFPSQFTDFVKEKVGSVRKILVDQGFLKDDKVDGKTTVSRALQKARDAHGQAKQETSRLRIELDTTTSSINADYGPDEVFRAIKGDCADLNTGEYTYTVCIMGQVTQKSNKDTTNTNLGYSFTS
jgi:protein kinase C substrate 80K-H